MAKFVPYSVNSGKFNMEFDEKLLNFSIENKLKEPILRLYGWKPACVSLGRNQKTESIDLAFCKENNIDNVKRITGGRALFHDKEITYCFICPNEFLKAHDSVILSYKEISSALIKGMKKLEIDVDFPFQKNVKASAEYCMSLSTGADLSYNGKKIIGSAQVRKSGYILQHGSILIDIDFGRIKKLFQEQVNADEITFLNEINKNLTLQELIPAIKEGFEEEFNLCFTEFGESNL